MTEKTTIKNSGATFTPTQLANFLADKLVDFANTQNKIKILDPACGDGELLHSIGSLLKEKGASFHLTGYDTNSQYLGLAKNKLNEIDSSNHRLLNKDFLEESYNEDYDIVIANPPYVRTQILGSDKAQYLAGKFNLSGRVDLYHPFLIAMTESLKKGGVLGVITSNRFLSTNAGKSVRKYLANNFEITELIDLGDTKLFDAAVLPSIFMGKKCKPHSSQESEANFLKIYEFTPTSTEDIINVKSLFDGLKLNKTCNYKFDDKFYKQTQGTLKFEYKFGLPWELLTTDEIKWINTINSNSKSRVKDHFKVRVGIKTTADKIFIKSNWETLGDDIPEKELIKELISQENVQAWRLNGKKHQQVLYTHYSENDKKKVINLENYPKAKKYLLTHNKRLSNRTYVINSGRKWFEIWVPQNPALWSNPKLVFPDISVFPRFYLDREGKIVNGNCYWITATKDYEIEKLLLIQGVANSNLMTKYHDLVFNNKLYSGRRRYFTQYVEKYPLPDINLKASKAIIKVVNKLNSTTENKLIKRLEQDLEILVANAFGVKPIFNQD